jgi:DNA-binding XRE family transcriptional regulator
LEQPSVGDEKSQPKFQVVNFSSVCERAVMRRAAKPQPALGAAIRELRRERGITQEALAHQAELTVGHLSMIERGHANPSWGAVVGLANALGVTVAELAQRSEHS